MSEVFCENCRWLANDAKRPNTWFCEAPQNKQKIKTWLRITEVLVNNPADLNKNNNCPFWSI